MTPHLPAPPACPACEPVRLRHTAADHAELHLAAVVDALPALPTDVRSALYIDAGVHHGTGWARLPADQRARAAAREWLHQHDGRRGAHERPPDARRAPP